MPKDFDRQVLFLLLEVQIRQMNVAREKWKKFSGECWDYISQSE